MTSPRILFSAGTLAILVHFAFAIECYRCESYVDENCGENFKSEGLMISDCDEEDAPRFGGFTLIGQNNSVTSGIGPTMCARITAKKQGKTVIIRRCFYTDSENRINCVPSPAEHGVVYEMCRLCDDDLCNGGPSSSSSVGLLLMIGATFISIFVK